MNHHARAVQYSLAPGKSRTERECQTLDALRIANDPAGRSTRKESLTRQKPAEMTKLRAESLPGVSLESNNPLRFRPADTLHIQSVELPTVESESIPSYIFAKALLTYPARP